MPANGCGVSSWGVSHVQKWIMVIVPHSVNILDTTELYT